MAFVKKRLEDAGSFGRSLQDLRELRGLTREELAERTHIHESIIAALEEERFADLKDPAYSERHVRVLVQHLEGPSGYFLPHYRELLAEQTKDISSRFLVQTPRRRDFFVLSRFVFVSLFFAAVGLAGVYLVWQTRTLQQAPSLVLMTPTEGQGFTTPHVEIVGDTDPNARVTVNGQNAVVDPAGHFVFSLDVARGLTTITIEAQKRYGGKTSVTRRITYER